MRALAWMLLVGTSGCLLDPNVTNLKAECRVFQRAHDRMYVESDEVVVDVGEQIQCTRGLARQATKVSLKVADTAGVEVTATAGEISHLGWTNAASVTFTPSHPGTWILEATFDSNTKTLRYELQVVALAHPAEQVLPWNGPKDCVQLALTSKQTLLCMQSLAVSQVVTARGEVFEGVAFERDGDALWRLSKDGVLERRVDDGAAFTVTHSGSPAGLVGPMVVVAGDAWLPSGADKLAKVHPEADGTFSVKTIPRPKLKVAAIAGSDRGLMLWILDPDPNRPSLIYVDPAGVAQPRQMFTGHEVHFLMGVDGDHLWTDAQYWTDEDPSAHERLTLSRMSGPVNAPVGATTLEFSQYIQISHLYDQVFGSAPPLMAMSAVGDGEMKLHPRMAVPGFAGDRLSFETYVVGDGFGQLHSVTRTHAFAFALDGKSVKVFTRN